MSYLENNAIQQNRLQYLCKDPTKLLTLDTEK